MYIVKVLFIHGLASSGAYKMAGSLRILLKQSQVLSPDIPIEPQAALSLLQSIISREQPELVVGLSLGGFWAQKLRGCPKILVNPDFHPSRLLRTMIGEQSYLSPRADGATSFRITEAICEGYAEIERDQFTSLNAGEISITRGLFATEDEITHCGPEFEQHYPGCDVSYPGGHLPNFPQLKAYLLPVVEELISKTR